MTTTSLAALNWQVYAGNQTDLIAPVLIDLSTFTGISVVPTGAGIGAAANVPATGVVIDNMGGAGDLLVTIGPIQTLVPRFQKANLPIPPTTPQVTFQGSVIKPIAYFYTGVFHGEGGSVNAFASQEAANVASITGGTTDAYLDSITWNKDVQLPNGYNLDNLTISGFYDVLNPTNAGTALPAGTWQVTCLVYSASNLEIYQLARNLLSTDTQVYERRCVLGAWTPWRDIGRSVTGQCQFQYVSATACKLVPFGGGFLNVNGNVEQVPFNAGNGVPFVNTLTNVTGGAAMAASTLYYAYVYMSAGVMSGEWSTTPFGLDTKGNPIKSGDPTRTCVGMIYTDAAGKFQSIPAAQGVATYYNQFTRPCFASAIGNSSSTTPVTNCQVGFLSWGINSQKLTFSGYTSQPNQGGTCYQQINVGGVVQSQTAVSSNVGNYLGAFSTDYDGAPPLGWNVALATWYVNSGTWNLTGYLQGSILQ